MASVLCHLSYAQDSCLQKTFQHFLDTQYMDGGWRCNKFIFGHGPEGEKSVLATQRFQEILANLG